MRCGLWRSRSVMWIVRGLAGLIASIAITPASAQFESAIRGIVSEQSGAVLPAAAIQLTNADTHVTQNTTANATGAYYFPKLAPGNYELRVQAQGFQTIVRQNIHLAPGSIQDVPVSLNVASTDEVVTVTVAPPLVQTDMATIANTIGEDQMRDLPMQGRNFINVVAQAPGIVGTGAMGTSTDIFANDQLPAMSANGQPASANTTYLDGTYLSDSPSLGFVKVVPNPDSISEMTVSTNDYSAAFGLGGGTLTQLTSRSGANKFHGALFEFHQDNKLLARTEFQNAVNPATGRILPVSRRNEFGGAFGGPIRRDQTFFWFTYDQVKGSAAYAYQTTVETPDFVSYVQQNYPNNISTSLLAKFKPTIGPLSNLQTVADLSSGCSGTGPMGLPCTLDVLGSGVHSYSNPEDALQWNIRVDQNFHSGDKVYGNFYYVPAKQVNDAVRPDFIQHARNNAYFAATNWVHPFSSSMILSSGIGATHQSYHTDCPNCQVPGVGVVGMTGFSSGFIAQNGFANMDSHWREVLTLTHGRHNLDTGWEMLHDQNFAKFTQTASLPGYTFLDVFSFINDSPQFQSVSFDPRSGGVANDNKYWVRSHYAAHVQDNWKVKPNLSLNLGLRWDLDSNPSESHGHRSNVVLGPGSDLRSQLATATVQVDRNAFRGEHWAYFAPRLGFAWQPSFSKNTSIRAGFGLNFNRGGDTIWSDTAFGNPPFIASITANVFVPSGPQPVFGLCQSAKFPFNCPRPPLPVGITPQGGAVAGLADVGGTNLKLRDATSQTWFVGLQQSIHNSWVIEADYSGSRDINLFAITNRNRYAGDRVLHNGNVTRLNPYFGAINYADNDNESWYDGGDVAVRRNLTNGVSLQAAFTFGKAIDYMGGAPGCNRCSENDGVFDAWNIKGQRALSEGDVNKQLSFNAVWNVPIPRNWQHVEKAVFGGWQASTVGILHAGTPQTVFSGTADYNGDGNYYDMPNAPTWGRTKTGLKRSDYLKGVFAASEFPSPCPTADPCGVEGNLGRDTFRGPGFSQVDMSFAKTNHIPWLVSEGAETKFRVEMYNAFNRVNLTGWDTNLSDGLFGKATGTYQARTIQLSLRIDF